MGVLATLLAVSLLGACSAHLYEETVNLLSNNMMRYPTYENILKYQKAHHHHREKRQSIKGSSNIHDVVELDDTESFHGPNVLLPEVSWQVDSGM